MRVRISPGLQMNTIEIDYGDYPYKILWGNGVSWSLYKTLREAEDMIEKVILKDYTWLTTSEYNRYK